MTLKTLKDLPLVESFTQPISNITKNFYLGTLAKGSGPNGLLLISDFFGGSTGPQATGSILTVVDIIEEQLDNGTLLPLDAIYANMAGSVNGTFGNPVSGPIVIPSGPGAGTYADADNALATLIPLAVTAISDAAAAMGDATVSLNSAFSQPAAGTVSEQELQLEAGIDFDELIEGAEAPVLALILSVPSLSTSDATGRPAQFFESVIDKTSVAGQALVGALREGQNSVVLNQAGINQYSKIPARD